MISALCCSLLCLFVFAKVGLDLDNSDYAFEHVGHNHVRFELKDLAMPARVVTKTLVMNAVGDDKLPSFLTGMVIIGHDIRIPK